MAATTQLGGVYDIVFNSLELAMSVKLCSEAVAMILLGVVVVDDEHTLLGRSWTETTFTRAGFKTGVLGPAGGAGRWSALCSFAFPTGSLSNIDAVAREYKLLGLSKGDDNSGSRMVTWRPAAFGTITELLDPSIIAS